MSNSLSVQHLSIIKKRDHWETPPNLFTEACVSYHIKPELDVCATLKDKKCDEYFGLDHKDPARRNALGMEWDSNFFMNPPYTKIDEFMYYAFDQIWKHRVNALMLTYSKTGNQWWHIYIENNPIVKTHFIKGRIKFWENGKPSKNVAPYDSVWLVVKIPKRSKK